VLIVLSPAKSLDYESPLATTRHTQPRLLNHSQELIDVMATKSPEEIGRLMSISPALSELNFERFQSWGQPFRKGPARAALLAFDGDVYDGMNARNTFSEDDFSYAQSTLRMLSGLYGVLRPLDLMLPYRLEMGTRLTTPKGKDLYSFWGDDITNMLAADLKKSRGEKVLINLASEEYFGAVRPTKLGVPIVAPRFLDVGPNGGDAKIISFFAKKARGVMAAWIIQQRITSSADLTQFTGSGYEYDESQSSPSTPVFVRSK
jgi:uncharacterized protein